MKGDKLTLTEVDGWVIFASLDERRMGAVGYFATKQEADLKAPHAGWYGSKGEVQPITLYTDGDYLFNLDKVGTVRPKEEIEAERKAAIAKVKAKLTKDELKLLGL